MISADPISTEVASWFCLRTQPKHEAMVAAHLKVDLGLEVYFPRIKFRRSTRTGPVWTTEPLFPAYLFARFDLVRCLRQVHYARGVRRIVHFGNHWPSVPTPVIEELRATVGADHVHVIHDEFKPGDQALISGGAFHGLQVVVSRVMPSRQRVAVLLEFLGQRITAEVEKEQLLPERRGILAVGKG